jgi:hypothetical protein
MKQPAPRQDRTGKTERSMAGRVMSETNHTPRKPSGPVIYTIEKGADVWPTRKPHPQSRPR